MFPLCEDKSAALLLSSPARSLQEGQVTSDRPSLVLLFLLIAPVVLLSAPTSFQKRICEKPAPWLQRSSFLRLLLFFFHFFKPLRKTRQVLPGCFLPARSACAEKVRGSSCRLRCAKPGRCQSVDRTQQTVCVRPPRTRPLVSELLPPDV